MKSFFLGNSLRLNPQTKIESLIFQHSGLFVPSNTFALPLGPAKLKTVSDRNTVTH